MKEIDGNKAEDAHKPEANRFEGTVKSFDASRKFGFITWEDAGKEVFVHQEAVIGEGSRTLAAGDRVSFEVVQGPKGPRAANVNKL